MPLDPPRGYRLWRAFIRTPLHKILDPPQEIPLENAGNGICKILNFKIFWLGGAYYFFYQPTIFFISHPLQNLLRIDKESQFLAMSNIKFILLPAASPPGPPTGLCPCTPLGASATPRPLARVWAFSPHSRLLYKYHRLLQILLTTLLRLSNLVDLSFEYLSFSIKQKTTILFPSLTLWGCTYLYIPCKGVPPCTLP